MVAKILADFDERPTDATASESAKLTMAQRAVRAEAKLPSRAMLRIRVSFGNLDTKCPRRRSEAKASAAQGNALVLTIRLADVTILVSGESYCVAK